MKSTFCSIGIDRVDFACSAIIVRVQTIENRYFISAVWRDDFMTLDLYFENRCAVR
jgi:hypothetical protein